MGSVGGSYDNALAETINGLFKAEFAHKGEPWKGLGNVGHATLTWVEWFNNRRIPEPIGDTPPAEYEISKPGHVKPNDPGKNASDKPKAVQVFSLENE